MFRIHSFLLLWTALAALIPAQPPACAGFTCTAGWDETIAATPLGGGTGPEDIAYNPVTGTLFVGHDFPNATPDILLEYTLDGVLVSSSTSVPGVGGLCALPNGNLLTTNGNTIQEVDTAGNPVPGGIFVTLPAYGNIQDLDFDGQGNLWIHNGNNGDFSIVNLQTSTSTTQFILQTVLGPGVPPAVTGSQAMTFNDAGNILAAAAFFQNGGLSNGTLFEITPTGTVLCQGAAPNAARLQFNNDPCTTSPANFTIVNGLTWIAPRREFAISNFFLVNGANIARFAPAGTAYLGRIGADATRADGLVFRVLTSGDAVIGSSGFVLTQTNIYPGDTLFLGVSGARLCTNPPLGSGILYIDPLPPNLLLLIGIPVASSTFTLPVDLSTVSPSAAGVDLFVQFGGVDFGATALPALLSACIRVHFDLN
jgi:hypothetical protein